MQMCLSSIRRYYSRLASRRPPPPSAAVATCSCVAVDIGGAAATEISQPRERKTQLPHQPGRSQMSTDYWNARSRYKGVDPRFIAKSFQRKPPHRPLEACDGVFDLNLFLSSGKADIPEVPAHGNRNRRGVLSDECILVKSPSRHTDRVSERPSTSTWLR